MINLNDVAGTNEDGTPVLQLERYEMHDISVIVDRLVMRDGIDRRLTDSIETALKLADGVMQVEILKEKGQPELLTFSIHFSRPSDGKSLKSWSLAISVLTPHTVLVFHVMDWERALRWIRN